jgi:mannose-6-phosphate isomerase-like protein (cupin superfamily)
MTMRVTRLREAEPFAPAGHAGVGPVRLQGSESTPTTDFTVALSHYLPGGAAELSPQPSETVYVVLSGELVMSSEGVDETLVAYDSVHFTPGTLRTVENRTHLPASMLVIRAVEKS